MPTIVADCPRCSANHMTFDVLGDAYTGISYDWMTHHEVAVRCRRCGHLSILKISLRNIDRKRDFRADGTISKVEGDLEPAFQKAGFLDVSDLAGVAEAPEHLPSEVHEAFVEGAKCMAIGCHNAAGAMFRLALDLTTKPLLPDSNNSTTPQPSKLQRFKLADRIDWLIEQGSIPASLARLAHCVRQDGNDGAHDGTLDKKDAEDLLDFTTALLERQFTEPERLRIAEQRRIDRRRPAAEAMPG